MNKAGTYPVRASDRKAVAIEAPLGARLPALDTLRVWLIVSPVAVHSRTAHVRGALLPAPR